MVYRRAEVLSGGMGKGFFYPGYIRAKRDLGLTDKSIGDVSWKLGVSVGGYAAAAMSLGLSPEEVDSFIEENISSIRKTFEPDPSLIAHYVYKKISKKISNIFLRKNYANGENGHYDEKEIERAGFFNSEKLEKIARKLAGDKKFRDLPDLNLLATEWGVFRPVLLNSETCPDLPVYKGLAATSAYDFMSPVIIEINGERRIFTDGGTSNNFPLYLVLSRKDLEETVCIDLLNVSSASRLPFTDDPLKNFVIKELFSGAEKKRLTLGLGFDDDYKEVASEKIAAIRKNREGKKILLFNPNIHYSRTFRSDIENIKELSEVGYRESLEALTLFEEFNTGQNQPTNL